MGVGFMPTCQQYLEYQQYLENLVNTRFNFFLVFFVLVIGSAMTSNNPLRIGIILTIGAVISIPIVLAIARAQLKMDFALDKIIKGEDCKDEPAKIIDDMAKGKFPPSMRKCIGYVVPYTCCGILIFGAIAAWLGCFGAI